MYSKWGLYIEECNFHWTTFLNAVAFSQFSPWHWLRIECKADAIIVIICFGYRDGVYFIVFIFVTYWKWVSHVSISCHLRFAYVPFSQFAAVSVHRTCSSISCRAAFHACRIIGVKIRTRYMHVWCKLWIFVSMLVNGIEFWLCRKVHSVRTRSLKLWHSGQPKKN